MPAPPTVPPPTAEQLQQLGALLRDARDAMSKQKFEAANLHLEKAEALAKVPEYQALVARAKALAFYAAEYRKGLEKAVAEFQPSDNVQVGQSTFVSIVSTEEDRLTLRVAGMTRTYTLANLPWALSLAMADTWLDLAAPSSFAAKAAYLLTLPKADANAQAKAIEFLQTAADGGIETEPLQRAAQDSYDLPTVSTP